MVFMGSKASKRILNRYYMISFTVSLHKRVYNGLWRNLSVTQVFLWIGAFSMLHGKAETLAIKVSLRTSFTTHTHTQLVQKKKYKTLVLICFFFFSIKGVLLHLALKTKTQKLC